MSRYACHDCGTSHTEDNMVAFCASCVHKITERFALEMSRKDAAIRKLEEQKDNLEEKNPWVCLVHGYKALPVCGLCVKSDSADLQRVRDDADAAVGKLRAELSNARDILTRWRRGVKSGVTIGDPAHDADKFLRGKK